VGGGPAVDRSREKLRRDEDGRATLVVSWSLRAMLASAAC